ncbi:hypothetical protein SFRURICE_007722 [Spodoptera frugiperda]|nr:hypothetical protein SFRURICE_007722 [Spodoptera frugiperda]
MSRLGRTRRTRVYDCNFDKGESYYRPVLDRLDGKTPVPRASEPDRDRIRSDVENRIKSALDDVEAPMDDLFDSRGARVQRGRPLSSAFDTEELSDDKRILQIRAGSHYANRVRAKRLSDGNKCGTFCIQPVHRMATVHKHVAAAVVFYSVIVGTCPGTIRHG